MNHLTQDIPLTRICGQRDAALRMMEEAAALIARGHALAREAQAMARQASGGVVFGLVDRRDHPSYRRLFESFDSVASLEIFRHQVDASVWQHLWSVTGLDLLMDATAKEEHLAGLASPDVPEVTEDNVRATMEARAAEAHLTFQRGLARAFVELDPRFKSHDAFKIKDRIILTHVFDTWGGWSAYGKTRHMLADVERVLAVLDGQRPEPRELERAIEASRGNDHGPKQGVCESRYLKIRSYKNGNAHLWFTRPDLVRKANQVLADYYGEVLPDAYPADVDTRDLRTTSGVPARNLSFYASPDPVVQSLLRDLYVPDGGRVLEPSAGEGAIARALVGRGWQVEAVEIHPGRVEALQQIRGLRVLPGNFLRMPARPVFAAVVMNPPFYGTHWMEHVQHAYDWLAPGGTLRAVLPATAEVGQSRKHEAFRAWAAKRSGWRDEANFTDLPPESFAEAGTRVQTVILELCKPR